MHPLTYWVAAWTHGAATWGHMWSTPLTLLTLLTLLTQLTLLTLLTHKLVGEALEGRVSGEGLRSQVGEAVEELQQLAPQLRHPGHAAHLPNGDEAAGGEERLQPYVTQAATTCDKGGNRI